MNDKDRRIEVGGFSGHQVIRSSGHQSQPVVLHCTESFIPVTENWIYRQVVGTQRYRPVVLTERRENADQFPFDPVLFPDTHRPDYRALCVPVRRNRLAVPLQTLSRAYLATVQSSEFRVQRNGRLCRHPEPCTLNPEPSLLLHAHFGTQAVHLLRLRRRLGVPLVTTFYGYDASSIPSLPMWRHWYRWLFREGDRFLVEGSAFRQRLIGLGCPAEKVTVQHLGVEVEAIPFRHRTPPAPPPGRGRSGGGPIRLLMAASFREKKGHEVALRAFKAVQSAGLRVHGKGRLCRTPEPCTLNPELSLTLIGDGELRPRMEALARELGIASAVRFLGAQPHRVFLEEALACDLFLSPSVTAADGDTEGGAPVGLIEAIATGMPALGTTHADIPEVIREGESGWLAPERDVDALARHLVGLLEHPERWPELGERGRRHVEAEYNARIQARRLDDIYDEVRRLAKDWSG